MASDAVDAATDRVCVFFPFQPKMRIKSSLPSYGMDNDVQFTAPEVGDTSGDPGTCHMNQTFWVHVVRAVLDISSKIMCGGRAAVLQWEQREIFSLFTQMISLRPF